MRMTCFKTTILSFSSITIIFLMLISLQSCTKPSFPKERVIESVKELCELEYDLDVDVKISGKTIGTYLELDNLFDMKDGIDKNAAERIGNLLLSVSRVCLSTDADFDFYVVIAADKKIPGMEAVFIRYVNDIKRFLLANISREDFFQRLLINVRFNPQMLSRRTIIKFFSLLSKGNSQKILSQYLGKLTENKELLLTFLRMILELKMKKNVHYRILSLKLKPLSEDKILAYCKVRETYKPKKGYTQEDFMFSPSFDNEYLFVIGARNYSPAINEIIPLYTSEKGIIQKKELPEEYREYGDFEKWSDSDILLENLKLEDFIAGQIAQRIIREVKRLEDEHENKKEKNKKRGKEVEEKPLFDFSIKSVKGFYKKNDKKYFELDFILSDVPKKNILPQDLIDLSMKMTKKTLSRYYFKDYDEIIMSSDPTKKIIRNFHKKALRSY